MGFGGAVCTEIGIVLVTVLPASSETVRPTLYRPGTGKTFDGFCASEKSPSSKVHAYCVTVRPGELAVAENVTATPGGPVLGSAFVLAAPLQLGEIRLETGAGIVPVVLEREGARISFGWMSQPVPRWEPFAKADELLALLGVASSLPVELYHLGPTHVYVAR